MAILYFLINITFSFNYYLPSNVRVEVEKKEGIVLQDFSKGIRLEELNVLLKQTVMVSSWSQ